MSLTLTRRPLSEADAEVEARPSRTDRHPLRRWYGVMLAGGALGVGTAAWQTVERINWASNPDSLSVCEISSKISCSSVFEHWQASALGVPNSVIATPVFAIIAAAALAGLMGSRLSPRYLAAVFGLTVFMTAFITWYMAETAYDIGVLCLFCTGCMVAILIAAVGVTRVAAAEGALGEGRAGRGLRMLVDANADLLAWGGLALIVAAMLFSGLAL